MNVSIALFVLIVVMRGLVNAALALGDLQGDYDYSNDDEQFSMESFENSSEEDKRPFVLLLPIKNLDEIDDSDKRETVELNQVASRSRKTRCKYPNILRKPRLTTITEDPREHNLVPRSTSTKGIVENSQNKQYFHKASANNAKRLENNLRESRTRKHEYEEAFRERVILQPRSQDSVILFSKKSKKPIDKGPKKYVCYCAEEEDYETTKLSMKPSTSYKTKEKRVPDISAESRYSNQQSHEKSSKLVSSEESGDSNRSGENSAFAILMNESGSSKRLGRAPTDSPILPRPIRKKIRPETILPCVTESRRFGQPIKIDIPLTSVRKLGSNFYSADRKWPFEKILPSVIRQNEALVAASSDEISNGLRVGQDCVNNEEISYDAYQPLEIVPDVVNSAPYLSSHLTPEYLQNPTYPQYPPYGDGLLGSQKVASEKSADQPFLAQEKASCDENEVTTRGRNFVDLDECIRLYGPENCIVISETFDGHRHVENDPKYEYPTIGSYRQTEARGPIAELPHRPSTRCEYPTNVYNTDKLGGYDNSPGAATDEDKTFQQIGQYPQRQVYKLHPIMLFRYVAENQPTQKFVSESKSHNSKAANNGFIGSTKHQKKTNDFYEYDNHVDPKELPRYGKPNVEYLLPIEDESQTKEDLEACVESEDNENKVLKQVLKGTITEFPRFSNTEISQNLQATQEISLNRYADTTIKATKEDDSLSKDIQNWQKIAGNVEYTTIQSDYTTRPDDQLGITKQPNSVDDYLTDDEGSPKVTTQCGQKFFTTMEESKDNRDATILPESRNFNEFPGSREDWYPTTENKEHEVAYVLEEREPEYRGSAPTSLTTTNVEDETVSSWPAGREEYDENSEESNVSKSVTDIISRPELSETHSTENTSWDEESFEARSTEKLDTAVKKLPIIPVKEHVFKDGHWREENAFVGNKKQYFEPEWSAEKTSRKDKQIISSISQTLTINGNELEFTTIAMDHELLASSNDRATEDLTTNHHSTKNVVEMTNEVYNTMTEGSPVIYRSIINKEEDEKIPIKYYSPTDRMLVYRKNVGNPEVMMQPQEKITLAPESTGTDLSAENYGSLVGTTTRELPPTTEDSIESVGLPESYSKYTETFLSGTSRGTTEESNEPWHMKTLAPVTENKNDYVPIASEFSSTIHPSDLNDKNHDYTTERYFGEEKSWTTEMNTKYGDIVRNTRSSMSGSTFDDTFGNGVMEQFSTNTDIDSNLKKEISLEPMDFSTTQESFVDEYDRYTADGHVGSENPVSTSKPEDITDIFSRSFDGKHDIATKLSSTEKIGDQANSLTTDKLDETSMETARNQDNDPSKQEISNERLGHPRDISIDYETPSPSSIDRMNYATPHWDPTYFGKITMNSVNPVGGKISDLKNTDLFYIGDGVKIPLKITRMPDGSWGLSISDKIFLSPKTLPRDGDVVEERKRSSEALNGQYDIESTVRGDRLDYLNEAKNSDIIGEKKGRYARSFLKSDVIATRKTPVFEFAKRYNLTLDLPDFPNGTVRSWRKMMKPSVDIANTRKIDHEGSLNHAQHLKLFRNENLIRSDDSEKNEARIVDDYDTEEMVPEAERAKKVLNALDGMTNSSSVQNHDPILDYHNILERTKENLRQDPGQWNENGDYDLTTVAKEMVKYDYQRDNPILESIRSVEKVQMEHGPYRYQRNIEHEAKERMDVMTNALHWLKKVFVANPQSTMISDYT